VTREGVQTFHDKLRASPQKRLLALDGGGIRGVITLSVLAKIEHVLRQKTSNDGLVLADYFDYIAGTSTGAIIATCLALGMQTKDVSQFYLNSGPAMFTKAGLLQRFRYKYAQQALTDELKSVFGENTLLGSPNLRTLLMMVMRNATTDSPWPICNNPAAKYNELKRSDCNLNLPLWQLVRASTAAPTYFPPELISVGERNFLFVDGGVTMYNNPAFQLFRMATMEPYKLEWRTGIDRMLLISIGTGSSPEANANLQPGEMNLIYNAASIPSALMFAALNEQDFLCRTFGDCLAGSLIDRELGDMRGLRGPVTPKLFTYLRYNADLTESGLKQLGLMNISPRSVQALDTVDHITELEEVGQALAERSVSQSHFDRFPPRSSALTIIALAGRRVDPPDWQERRFPEANLEVVAERIRLLLTSCNCTTLVSSAACGADLLALEIAGDLGIRRYVVLPFSRDTFRAKSVVDRPGDWGDRYDRVLEEVSRQGGLLILGLSDSEATAYAETNRMIIERALEIGVENAATTTAVVVWDQNPRSSNDSSEQFMREALRRGVSVVEVSTKD
jgi:uncharacterized protein